MPSPRAEAIVQLRVYDNDDPAGRMVGVEIDPDIWTRLDPIVKQMIWRGLTQTAMEQWDAKDAEEERAAAAAVEGPPDEEPCSTLS